MLDIIFIILGCVKSKNGRGRGFWIAALVIDILAVIGSTAEADYPVATFLVAACILCAVYIPTGIMISRRYRAFAEAQQAQPWQPAQPGQPGYAPAQPQQAPSYYTPPQPIGSAAPAAQPEAQQNYYQPTPAQDQSLNNNWNE